MLACAAGLAWWGDQPVWFPHLGGGPKTPVTGAQCLPLVMACVLVLSTGDALADFSEHAARSRRRVVALHLAAATALALALCTAALLAAGSLDQLPTAARNLLGFLGLAALGAGALGLLSSWTVPLAWAVPAFLLSGTPPRAWWEWPLASAATAWGPALVLAATGLAALLLRTAARR